jgi:hypothetical protein
MSSAPIMKYGPREFPKRFPGCRYPLNTVLRVDWLVNEKFLIEVQAIAAL